MIINGPRYPSVERLRLATEHLTGTMTFGVAGVWKDKFIQLTALRDSSISVPMFSLQLGTTKQLVRSGKSMWGRKRRHSHGTDIAIDPNSRKWRNSDFWVEAILDVKQEWRVHVFNYARNGEKVDYRVIASGRKVWNGESSCPHERRTIHPGCCDICNVVRSRCNGWIITRDEKPSKAVYNIAKKAVAVLGMQYGAVDMLERNDGSVVVLEVNFAPAMDNRTRNCYVRALEHVWGVS